MLFGLRQLFERIRAAQGGGLGRDINEIALLVFSRVTDRLVQPLYEALLHERDGGLLETAINTHALRVHLVIQHDEQLRFLAAQGVAEVLTAILFYRNIADHFSLGPLLGGTVPLYRSGPAWATYAQLRSSHRCLRRLRDDSATQPNCQARPDKRWRASPRALKGLIAFVGQLDFTTVTSDVIGSIFERLISPERRHAMGQHLHILGSPIDKSMGTARAYRHYRRHLMWCRNLSRRIAPPYGEFRPVSQANSRTIARQRYRPVCRPPLRRSIWLPETFIAVQITRPCVWAMLSILSLGYRLSTYNPPTLSGFSLGGQVGFGRHGG